MSYGCKCNTARDVSRAYYMGLQRCLRTKLEIQTSKNTKQKNRGTFGSCVEFQNFCSWKNLSIILSHSRAATLFCLWIEYRDLISQPSRAAALNDYLFQGPLNLFIASIYEETSRWMEAEACIVQGTGHKELCVLQAVKVSAPSCFPVHRG